jgi:FdhD protein
MTWLIAPNISNAKLTAQVSGINERGERTPSHVPVEKALTLYLNAQEIVTMMTINDYPQLLALGYLLNQNMLAPQDVVEAIDYDEDLEVVVVRTQHHTNFEAKLKKRTQTSGCAQGTSFGDLMESLEGFTHAPPVLNTSTLYKIAQMVNTTPSLYLEAGAIHGCALFQGETPLVFMEDVGRHNAVDKIAGWMFEQKQSGEGKVFYTTGRLTSEMVIKAARMRVPVLISRSGFTAWGVELAQKLGIMLIGRVRGKRFLALTGGEHLIFDQDLAYVEEETLKSKRKGAAALI